MQGNDKKTTKWLLGGGVITAAVVALSFLNLGDNLIYFYTPGEAFAKSAELDGQTIKVGGMVKQGTVNWQAEQLLLKFVLTDMDGTEINVSHNGTPPDMFKQGSGVVVEGRLMDNGNVIVSKHLLVKHSEEYKAPSEHGTMNKELLEKSLFKGQQP